MSIVKINEITVPDDKADQLRSRFAANAHTLAGLDGFERFELLAPTDGADRWLVVTHWRDEDAYQAWLNGPAFEKAHGHKAGHAPAPNRPRPSGTASQIREFEVALTSDR